MKAIPTTKKEALRAFVDDNGNVVIVFRESCRVGSEPFQQVYPLVFEPLDIWNLRIRQVRESFYPED